MIDIVLSGTVGVVVVVAMFYLATVPGVVSAVVYVTLAVVSLYCWAIVLSAYKQLGQAAGQAGYVYSPVSAAKEMPPYYPSAPQYFVMEEYGEWPQQSRGTREETSFITPLQAGPAPAGRRAGRTRESRASRIS